MLQMKVCDVKSGLTGELLYKTAWVWCPGCDDLHQFIIELFNDQNKPVWQWNGNMTHPTFEPSNLTTWSGFNDEGKPEEQVCHSFLRDGVWDFLSDSTHALSGQRAGMVDLPYWFVNV